MEYLPTKSFPLSSEDYKLYEEVGEGVSATVYRALCIPRNEIVAIKVLDLERCNNDLDNIRREVHTMSLINHPNLLRAHCSFISGSSLWIVMPFMAGGSCFHIMKSVRPNGFEQPVIATVLCEILKALAYLHAQGHIHRDVKAGNILIDSKGAVKLGDFGVSASMFDSGDRQRSRNTFVGTPCWMAPEVMQQLHGYDFKADIWSFGITALELAHGHAPFSKYPPMKVLMMTLQNAPPGLDHERDKKFSKSFKEIVAACLVKDPKKRPSSEKLLKHRFFKHSRSNEFLARTILDGLSPLGDRFRMLKEKEAEFLAQNKAIYGDKEVLSQKEYIRGISEWNFDLEGLKKQATHIQDCDGISNGLQDLSSKEEGSDNLAVLGDRLSMQITNSSNCEKSTLLPEDGSKEMNNVQIVESSLASYPVRPPELQPLNSHFDSHLDNVNGHSSNQEGANHSISKDSMEVLSSISDKGTRSFGSDDLKFFSSLPLDGNSGSSSFSWSVQSKNDVPLNSSPIGSNNSSVGGSINSMTSSSVSILSSLQRILVQNTMQREQTLRVIRYVDNLTEFMKATSHNEYMQMLSASVRERELQSQIINMQLRIRQLVDDLQEQKNKNSEVSF
ncbi:hypothetical protein MANES_13G029700v8 [Manihot esculenta]|uniref:Uncharacterized protein n=2 Tax=Manihot esculenta TaxID=3983 RepID=A0ACB7GIU7_MANES|nr:hypothetical protein MANES_13G029700v8 [Manihot esculenta]